MATFTPIPEGREWTSIELEQFRNFLDGEEFQRKSIESITSSFDIRKPVRQGDLLFYLPILENVEDLPELRKTPWRDVFFSDKTKDLTCQVTFHPPPPGGQFEKFDPQVVGEFVGDWEKLELSKTIHARFLGNAAYPWYMLDGLRKDAIRNIVILLLLLVLLRFFFGTWKSGLILSGSLIWTGVIFYGLMGTFGSPIDAITSSLFLMTTVAALEDFVFVSCERLSSGEKFKSPFRATLIPGFLTSVTTFIGFASLLTSDLGIIRRFGVWAGVSSILEWIAVFLLLPAALQALPSLRTWVDSKKARGHGPLSRLGKSGLPKKWSYASLLVFVVAAYSAGHLLVNDEAEAVFKKHHPFREGIAYLERSRGWRAEVSLLFKNQKDRKNNERILAVVAKDPLVALVENPYAMEEWLTKGFDQAGTEMVNRDIRRAGFFKRLVSPSGYARAEIYLRKIDALSVQRLQSDVTALCGENCELAGDIVAFAEFSETLPKTLIDSLVMSLILVGLTIFLFSRFLRRPNIGHVLVASFWGPATMLAGLSIFSVKINFITCIFATTLVGLTGDNAIQYLWAGRKVGLENGITRKGSASILCSLIMIVSTMTFLYSYFEQPQTLGVLLSAGFLFALIGDLWILKGLYPKSGH